MKRLFRALVVLLALIGAGTVLGGAWFALQGLASRPQPPAFEVRLSRAARHLLIPRAARARANPVPPSPTILSSARHHFADHCASCHGNDGKGQTEMGRGLYPKAPDMTAPETQRLSDGELFWIVENGIKLTGMPAWGGGPGHGEASEAESWALVHFLRHLPRIAPDELEEMQRYNPVSPAELQEQADEESFLDGGEPPPSPDSTHDSHRDVHRDLRRR